MPTLAEGPSFTGPEVTVIILVLLTMFLLICGVMVLGCILAQRAGRGSQNALVGWLVIAFFELMYLVRGLIDLPPELSVYIVAAVLVLQVGLFVAARRTGKD